MFERPRPLAASDDRAGFMSAEPSLNEWLARRALRNEKAGNSRTFVSIERGSRVVAGYYCLSSCSLIRDDAPSQMQRNAPDPIPGILIGRLAVDSRFEGRGLGRSLLQDAVLKGIQASRLIVAQAFIVHALSASAVSFYAKYGFELMPGSERAMYLRVADAEATLGVVAAE
ncbi:GNAT family N-acetyltransferase [Agromyces aerolatus]|uniref:GNAT family N-acetyltransferase n=1 Tax=Agromyces sp. LY-1074 TaxID=3074080 RepID=UPI0028655EC8|nr:MULTISPECIES: GNAT family N-acetyltransferase [unclassified Agromyces]MDR5700209.1 GNAT family N-acetyltransferase [Agromyces sp. LY-1074]MDR5706423.1 GNAT family N-acetyltransferase [Agromyces sp. LY-1358]